MGPIAKPRGEQYPAISATEPCSPDEATIDVGHKPWLC